MRRYRVLLLCVIALALTAGCVEFVGTQETGEIRNGTVTHVVDGDTVDVRFEDGSSDRVRLLGIDTPEVHAETEPGDFEGVPDTSDARACLRRVGENASAYVGDRVAGQRVQVETDPSADRRGGYDRLLGYVHHADENLNYALVDRGYAGIYPTTFQQRDRFEAAAERARAANRGLWRCRDPS